LVSYSVELIEELEKSVEEKDSTNKAIHLSKLLLQGKYKEILTDESIIKPFANDLAI
jgi:hypothetical protein